MVGRLCEWVAKCPTEMRMAGRPRCEFWMSTALERDGFGLLGDDVICAPAGSPPFNGSAGDELGIDRAAVLRSPFLDASHDRHQRLAGRRKSAGHAAPRLLDPLDPPIRSTRPVATRFYSLCVRNCRPRRGAHDGFRHIASRDASPGTRGYSPSICLQRQFGRTRKAMSPHG
jgi:hypothetical protein